MKGWLPACILVFAVASPAVSQQRSPGQDGTAVRIRQLVLPRDAILKWSGDGHLYHEVPRNEYERLVDRSLGRESLHRKPPEARLVEARYTARLVDGDLQEGRAELEIACDAISPVPLSLEPLSIAVGKAEWKGALASRPAVLGAGPDGRATLVVGPEDKHLEFTWSARGVRTGKGLFFALRFPRATVSSLSLELPRGFTPILSTGVVDGPLPAEGGFQRWDLHLGIHHEFELSLLRMPREERASPPMRVQQETTYEISESGVSIHSQLALHGGRSDLEPLRLLLDGDIRVWDVRLGDVALAWTISEARDEKAIHIPLPESFPELARVTLSALASLEPGKTWRLPRFRPQGVFWERSIVRIRVNHPLEIEQVRLEECRIRSSDQLSGRQGRELELQDFEPNANVWLRLGTARGSLHVDTAQVVRVSADAYQMTCTTSWKLSASRRFRVGYRVPPGWEVVDVETPAQPTRGRNWRLRPDPQGPGQILELDLTRALSADSTLYTLVRARRRNLGSADLAVAHPIPELVPLETNEHEGVIDFAVEGPYQANFERLDGLQPIDLNQPGEEGDHWRGLLPERPRGKQFRFKNRRHAGWVRFVPKVVSLTTRVEGDASLAAGTLTQHYRIRYESADAPSEQFLVYFSNSTNGQVDWRGTTQYDTPLRAHVLGPETHAAWRLPPDGELWEILLPTARTSFEMTARLQTPLGNQTSLNLPWPIGDRRPQTSLHMVLGTTGQLWNIDTTGAKRLPVTGLEESLFLGSPSRVTHAFTYDRPDARITVERIAPEAVRSEPVVWQARLESLLAPTGRQRHHLSLELEAQGIESLSLTFAEGDRVRGAWIDGTVSASVQKGRHLRLLLPRKSAPLEVIVEYEAEKQQWSWLRPIVVGLPQLDVPVAAFDWHVAVPLGYEPLRIPSRLKLLEPPEGFRSWSQRFFGPLGRQPGATRFNPLELHAWRSLFEQRENTEEPTAIVGRFDSAVRRFFDERDDKTPATLAELFQFLVAPELGLPPVLVDAAALEEAGWDSRTLLAAANGGRRAGGQGETFSLASFGLTILISPSGMVLTTEQETKRLGPWLRELAPEAFYAVTPSPLAGQIHDAVLAAGVSHERFQYTLNWAESTSGFARSQRSIDGLSFAERSQGWKVVRMTGMGLPHAPELRFCAQRSVAMLALSLFFITLFLMAAISHVAPRVGRRILIGAMVAAWSLAIFVPEGVVLLCAAVALGALSAGLLEVFRVHPRSLAIRPAPTKPMLSTIIRPATMGVLVVALGCLARGAWAQSASADPVVSTETLEGAPAPNATKSTPETASTERGDKEYFVLVPSEDGDGVDAGASVYVPGELLDLLRRPPVSQPAYVLAGGQYEGEVSNREARIRVRCNVFAYADRVPVLVSVPIDPGQLVPGSTLLDGEEVRPLPAEKLVKIEIVEPGLHQLEFRLRAPVRGTREGSQAILRIPALPQNSLRLRLQNSAALVNVPEARGALHRGEPDRLEIALGALEVLTIQRFDQAPATAGAKVQLRHEMLWDVQPASVELKTHFHYRVVEGSVGQLLWLLDSALELKHVSPPSLVENASLEPFGDDQNLLTLHLARPLTGDLDLQAEFVVRDREGIGHLKLPRLVPRNLEEQDGLVAILGNPQIHSRVIQAEGVTAIPVKDFLDRWGDGILDPMPERAYRIDREHVSLVLATRPPEPLKTAREQLLVRAGRDCLDLLLESDVRTKRAPSFQHRFSVSPEVQIEEVSVTEGNVERLDRWSRDAETGEMTLFLAQPTLGSQRIRIVARLPVPSPGEIDMPKLHSAQGTRVTGRILVIPNEELNIVLEQLDQLQPAQIMADDELAAEDDWIAAAYRFEVPAYSARVKITPNTTEVHALQKLVFRRRDEGWGLLTEILYRVNQGRVHRFDIHLPADFEWDERNVVTPGLTSAIIEAGRDSRILTVIPRQPVDGEFRLRLEGMLSDQAAGATVVPHIEPKGVTQLEQYLVFPEGNLVDDQLANNAALERVDLPSALASGEPFAADAPTYRAKRTDWQVLLPSHSQAAERGPVAFSAEVRIALDSHGTIWGEAVYRVFLSSQREIEFQWPKSAQLYGVTVDGLRAVARWRGDDTLLVALPAAVFPQRVVVRWHEERPGRLSRLDWMDLAAPLPKTFSVAKTWWTVRGPNGFKQFEARSTERTVEDLAPDLERLEAILQEQRHLSHRTILGTTVHSRRELIRTWLLRFDREVDQVLPRFVGAASAGSFEAQRSLKRLNELALDGRQLQRLLGLEDNQALRDAFAPGTGKEYSRFVLQPGPALSFSRSEQAAAVPGFWNVRTTLLWGALGSLLVGAIALAGWVVFRVSLLPLSPRQERLLGTVVGCGSGLAWWWWLEPSALGFAIVAVSLLALAWATLRARSRHEDSVVLIVAR